MPRLCKALIDRITDRANIIETGTDFYRFRRTLEKHKGRNAELNNITAQPPAERRREKGNLKRHLTLIISAELQLDN
jgi:hypothetical protein